LTAAATNTTTTTTTTTTKAAAVAAASTDSFRKRVAALKEQKCGEYFYFDIHFFLNGCICWLLLFCYTT